MTELIIVRVASTPMHAKLLVALLQSEGISATVEGEGLVDEFAMSQRMLNAAGTTVKVRQEDLERAQEVLAAAAIAVDAEELEKQAMEAAPEPGPQPVSQRSNGTMSHLPFVLIGAFLGGLGAWMARDVIEANALDAGAYHDYLPVDFGLREIWRQDRAFYYDFVDENGDGFYERLVGHTPATRSTTIDDDDDGRYDRIITHHGNGLVETLRRSDGAEVMNEIVIKDAAGKLVQHLRLVEGQGYQPVR